MSPHDEGVQAQNSDLTETPQNDYTQNNSEAKNDIQSKKEGGKDSQNSSEESNRNKSQGRDHERENDDGKDTVKKQEESNDEHDGTEGKGKSEQQSGEAKSGNGNGNGESKHPKVSKEALEGPQSPAPTTKYNFDEEAENGICWSIFIPSLHQANRYQMAPVRSPVKMKPTNPRIRKKTQTIRKTSLPSISMVGPWDISKTKCMDILGGSSSRGRNCI